MRPFLSNFIVKTCLFFYTFNSHFQIVASLVSYRFIFYRFCHFMFAKDGVAFLEDFILSFFQRLFSNYQFFVKNLIEAGSAGPRPWFWFLLMWQFYTGVSSLSGKVFDGGAIMRLRSLIFNESFTNVILDKTDGFDIPNQYYNEGDHNFDIVVLHQPTNMCTGRAKDCLPTMSQSLWLIQKAWPDGFGKRPFWQWSFWLLKLEIK